MVDNVYRLVTTHTGCWRRTRDAGDAHGMLATTWDAGDALLLMATVGQIISRVASDILIKYL